MSESESLTVCLPLLLLPFIVVYVVLSEIFPMGVRGRAVSVVSAVNWATNLLISMTFLTMTGMSVCVQMFDNINYTSKLLVPEPKQCSTY